MFLFFVGSKKKKKILRVHKGEGKGLKIQLILSVDLTNFWGEVLQNFPGRLVILKNLSMHAKVTYMLGERWQPLWFLNPHTNAAFLGKSPPRPFCSPRQPQARRGGAVQGPAAPASARGRREDFRAWSRKALRTTASVRISPKLLTEWNKRKQSCRGFYCITLNEPIGNPYLKNYELIIKNISESGSSHVRLYLIFTDLWGR